MSDDHHDSIDPRLLAAANDGCPESRLLVTRRNLLGLSASFFASAIIPDTALATTTDRRLIIVILRGGMDSLHVAIPFADSTYLQHRSLLYSTLSSTIALKDSTNPNLSDNSRVLHPSLSNFAKMYNDGQAAIIEGIAPPYRQRSHFACQFNLESGQDSRNLVVNDGWLNRLIKRLRAVDTVSTGGATNTVSAVSIGTTPVILQGGTPVLTWSPYGRGSGYPLAARQALLNYYNVADTPAGAALSRAIATDNLVTGDIDDPSTVPGSMKETFLGAARLMSSATGPRFGVLSVEGWDTHTSEGSNVTGIASRLAVLDEGLKAIKDEMTRNSLWGNTTVVCVTEFGRTLDLNKSDGTAGTEHGVGTIAMLAGGSVRGRKIYNKAPNLASVISNSANDDNFSGRPELKASLDTRQLFQAVLKDFMSIDMARHNGAVFPGTDINKIPSALQNMFTTSA